MRGAPVIARRNLSGALDLGFPRARIALFMLVPYGIIATYSF